MFLMCMKRSHLLIDGLLLFEQGNQASHGCNVDLLHRSILPPFHQLALFLFLPFYNPFSFLFLLLLLSGQYPNPSYPTMGRFLHQRP